MALPTALRSFASRLRRVAGETGASLVEYTLLVALIAAFAIGAISFLGGSAKNTLCDTGAKIAAGDSSATPVAGDCD